MSLRGRILSIARLFGDTSSATGVLGAKQGIIQRARTRAVGMGLGRLQMGMGVWGLAGMATLFFMIDKAIREANREELHVGTAVKYGDWLNDGRPSLGIEASHWYDKGLAKAERRIKHESRSSLFGDLLNPPSFGSVRNTIYEGQQFVSDIMSIASGGVIQRLASRAAGVSSARLFWGSLLGDDINPARIPALITQIELQKACRDAGHIDSGCLVNSIAIGRTRKEMKKKSAAGCLLHVKNSDNHSVKSKMEMIEI